ncbi:MAG: glycosyltransferase [Alphaproteobacteria bacterium]|nr:glycosyltransferase [Alphaproteobacteria bacterium]
MNILNLMLGKGLGGIEQAALDVALALSRHAEGAKVVSVLDPQAAVRGKFAGLEVRSLPNLGWWDPIAAWKLASILKQEKPDAVICHGNRALLLAARAAKGRWPVVAVAHNYQLRHVHRAFAGFGITRDLVGKLAEEGIPKERCFHVPNMIALEGAPARGQMRQPPVIGVMGRFVAKKGFDVFLRALAELAARGAAFEAVIGGDGEEAEALEKLCAQLGLEGRVRFIGWVEDKRVFFHDIDIFCLPSLHEPFGIVLLEAMAFGLPIVSTASEGPREIGTDGVDMRLVTVGDAQAMAEALEEMLRVPQKAVTLAEAAKARAAEYAYPAGAARIMGACAEIRAAWLKKA